VRDSSIQPQRNPPLPKRDESVVFGSFPFNGEDEQLVRSLRDRHPAAMVHFYSRFSAHVRNLLFRMLGPDSELDDTLHDTFVRALESIDKLRDPKALRAWTLGVAVHTARIALQRRRRRRWLSLFAPADLPEQPTNGAAPEALEALRTISRVLDRLQTDERIAVVLRLAERMTVPEAAATCGVSVSTFKRRFARGEKRFRELAANEPALTDMWEGGSDAP
jgi:RNA polymerase sigma-70 factor (ECF subfamily)